MQDEFLLWSVIYYVNEENNCCGVRYSMFEREIIVVE